MLFGCPAERHEPVIPRIRIGFAVEASTHGSVHAWTRQHEEASTRGRVDDSTHGRVEASTRVASIETTMRNFSKIRSF